MQQNELSLSHLMIGFIPVLLVLWLMWRNQHDVKKPAQAIARMLLQLLLIGYALLYIFQQASGLVVSAILLLMLLVASWIALNVVRRQSWPLYGSALAALLLGGGSTLLIVTQGVLAVQPWYRAQVVIPLAGMVFSAAMTGISLALERFESEMAAQNSEQLAQAKAFQAAMIPVVNAMFAVGLVSLPGMMTGQILSGVVPYIAARYQIMVMCMMFSSTGLTVYLFLKLYRRCRSALPCVG